MNKSHPQARYYNQERTIGMSLSRAYQETIILFNEADPTASIYTYNGKLKRRLEQISLKFPAEVKQAAICPTGAVTYELPKGLISVRQPVSEERRQAAKNSALISNLSRKSAV